MPFQAVAEAWRSAEPAEADSTALSRSELAFPLFVVAWWILFLAGGVIERLAGLRPPASADPLISLRASAVLELVATSVSSVAAVLAIVLIARLTVRQETKATMIEARGGLHAQPPPAPPPPPGDVAGQGALGANLDAPGASPG